MSDAEFEYYVEALGQANGLSEESIKRKLARYYQGRAQFTDSPEDWNHPNFDLLNEARKELDDLWLYLSKYLHDRPKDYTQTDLSLVTKLLAVVEILLNGRIAAQTAAVSSGRTDNVHTAGAAVGQPADSMEVCG